MDVNYAGRMVVFLVILSQYYVFSQWPVTNNSLLHTILSECFVFDNFKKTCKARQNLPLKSFLIL